MTNPTIKIHNVETGEVIEREMNAEELAQLETDQTEFAIKEQAKAEQAVAKQVLLARLGITEEEAVLLLGGTN
jgi:hypothetical protein